MSRSSWRKRLRDGICDDIGTRGGRTNRASISLSYCIGYGETGLVLTGFAPRSLSLGRLGGDGMRKLKTSFPFTMYLEIEFVNLGGCLGKYEDFYC